MLDRTAELKQAADFYLLRNILWRAGILSVLMGLFSVFAWLVLAADHTRFFLVPLFGAVMIGFGVRIIRSPSPRMLTVEAIEFLLLIPWTYFAGRFLLGKEFRNPLAWEIIAAGFAAGVFLWEYRRFAHLQGYDPCNQYLVEVGALMLSLRCNEPRRDASLIEFADINGKWRAKLTKDGMLLADRPQYHIFFAAKDELLIAEKGKTLWGSHLKATLRAGPRRLSVSIRPQYLERLKAWKSSTQAQS